MASEKAIETGARAICEENGLDPNEPIDPEFKQRWMMHANYAKAALDAAAAVDGDPVDIRIVTAYESGFEAGKEEASVAEWNAAVSRAAHIVIAFGVKDYTSEEVAARIRSLKRLK